jgi:hypothetical protein
MLDLPLSNEPLPGIKAGRRGRSIGSEGGRKSGLEGEERNRPGEGGRIVQQDVQVYTTSQKTKFYTFHEHSVNLVQFYYDIRHDLIFYQIDVVCVGRSK